MPVMIIDVPESSWNEVVIQTILHGLDMCPDNHREQGNTIVEVTGSWEKLNAVLNRAKRRAPENLTLLGVMGSVAINRCE